MLKQLGFFLVTAAMLSFVGYISIQLICQVDKVHGPIYLTDVVSCKAYRLGSYNCLSPTKSKAFPYIASAEDGTRMYAPSPLVRPGYWVIKGPVLCSPITITQIDNILRNSNSYGSDNGGVWWADYEFKLQGKAGYLIVDVGGDIFTVNKFNSDGSFVSTSGPVEPVRYGHTSSPDWRTIAGSIFPQ